MGHKVHPNGFRLGVYRNWEAKWFAPDKEYKPLLLEDVRLRRMLMIRLKNAGLARIETARSSSALTITLHTAKPGIVIGKGGTSVDQLRDELEKITGKRVRVTIQEIKKPELSAQLVAENVAAQLEKRIAFRRAIKQSLMKTMRAGAQGVKIRVKGRLGGSEMARVEWNREGRVPLHTLKADIDFGQTEAKTTFGRIGVSAWVYTGNFPTEAPPKPQAAVEEPADTGVPVGAAIAEAPTPLAELLQAAVAARRVMTRFVRRGGQVFIRVFPDKSVTKKPAETRMGSGKGAPEGWVAVIKPGRVLFEMGGVTPEMAKRAFQLAAYKLPLKTRTLGIKSGVKAAADVKIKGPAELKPGEGVEGIAGAGAAPVAAGAAAAAARGPKAAPGAAPSIKPAPGAAPKAAPGAAPRAAAAAPAKPAKGGGKK